MITMQAIGRLGKDAEVKTLESGKKVISFSLAVDTGYGDNKRTLWLDVSKWGENTAVAQYLTKGTQVHVDGEPSMRSYENKEQQTVTVLCLTAQRLTLVGGKGAEAPGPQPLNTPPAVEEKLPF